MQSSYRIIKSDMITSGGNKEIITNVDNTTNKNWVQSGEEENEDVNNEKVIEERAHKIISDAEEKAEKIIENALSRSSQTLLNANSEAVEIEKSAYEKGYAEGNQKGYTEAYDNNILRGQQDAERIINNANGILLNAKQEYEKYLETKEKELLDMTINMAEMVLKRELKSADGLNENIKEVLNTSRSMNSCIIRANGVHCEEIESNIEFWKQNNAIKCEIFIIPDEELGPYDAIIEKNNGKVEVGLKAGIEGIKKALL